MSLLVHTFRVWVQSLHGIHFITITAPCFDSAHCEATRQLQVGERIFCVDQISEIN